MSDFDVKEKRFEEDIEDYLTHHGGYTKGDPKKFNRESGLEEDTFVEFIKTSQPKKWERYVKIYAENSEKQIIERFKREVKTTNLLNVMRHGFMDRGIKFYPIFWKPETSLNETTQMQYDANILHCTRQLHYSVHNENSIDIVLFANGIPVVSMELKCQFTGQDTTNAINQYKFDRAGKDAIFAFKERVLVHFAVDLTNVYMTTRLEGAHTYFLPFNQGSNGAGKVGGKGNPVNPNGYDTAYLWERVLCKDSLMEILQKYMHLQQEYDKNGNLVKETMIFPRYHQLDVVTKLLEDVKKNGSGTLASFNRVYAYITQVCRLFDKDIHRFSIYSKFLYTMLPKGHGGEKINIDDKVLLEYYKLEKDFEGPIELESTEGGYTPISGDSGHREPKKDPLTVIIDKINEKYGTHFTEMDKVLVQMENDYANQEKWQSYAKNNDRATFMLLFEKDFPNMAADRYEQNDQFFRKLFDDPDMMRQVMETVGSVLYERLKKKYIFDPKSGVIEEATPETYVEDTYLTKK